MLYYVIFGESSNRHTKAYLYTSNQNYIPGMLVLVSSKKEVKISMIRSINKKMLENDKIKKIIQPFSGDINVHQIKSFVLSMIDDFKDGVITKEAFASTFECFLRYNRLDFGKHSNILKIIQNEIPDVCRLNVVEPGNAIEKNISFWKHLKSIEKRLRFGDSNEKLYSGYQHMIDPVETTDEYLNIELNLERQIREEIGEPDYKGYCHRYWSTKKRILKEEYHIDWKSPSDLNPLVFYD